MTEDLAVFTLRHKKLPFYLRKEYRRRFKSGTTPPDWKLNEVGLRGNVAPALSFKGRLDGRARAFITFFSRRYPKGDVVCHGVDLLSEVGGRQRFVASLGPRETPRASGRAHSWGGSSVYEYDADTGAWSSI